MDPLLVSAKTREGIDRILPEIIRRIPENFESPSIIGHLVLYCIEHNTNLDDLSLEEYQAISPVFNESVYDAISVKQCVEARNVIGGPSKAMTTKAIADNKAYLEKL